MAAPGAKVNRHYGSGLDGQEEDENGMFTSDDGGQAPYPGGFGDPAEDCRCRCVIRSEIKGYPPQDLKVPISEIPTYEDWLDAQG
jgi:hypothetical protein